MPDFKLDEYNRLETFEERKAYCLAHQVKQQLQLRPKDNIQQDYEKCGSYHNYEWGE